MQKYFELATLPVGRDGIVLGNVQLGEDRFPSPLLTFQSKQDCQDEKINSCRPRTGHVHDAIFYFDLEQPLSQLVKQRRRWINASFVANYWVASSGWVQGSDHSIWTKAGSMLLLFVELLNGLMVRLVGLGLVAASIFATCTEIMDSSILVASVATGLYLLVYVVFIVAHIPRAIRVSVDGETGWRCDEASAYRQTIFAVAIAANVLVTAFFLVSLAVILFGLSKTEHTPIFWWVFLLGYVAAAMDGLINSDRPNLRSFRIMVETTPCFVFSLIWLAVWLPGYATARMSDLTWGSRPGSHVELINTEMAQHRAWSGKQIAIFMILCNLVTTAVAIAVYQAFFPDDGFVFYAILTGALLVLHFFLLIVNMMDMIVRAVGRMLVFCASTTSAPIKSDVGKEGSETEETTVFVEEVEIEL